MVAEDEMVRQHGHEFEQIPEVVKVMGAWHAAVDGITKSQTQLSN